MVGLSEKEAKVYLACLMVGPSPIQQIAERAGVKRPTTYVMVKSLIERGLVCTTEAGKRTHFYACSPKKIVDILEEEKKANDRKQKAFKAALPELLAHLEQAVAPKKRETVKVAAR